MSIKMSEISIIGHSATNSSLESLERIPVHRPVIQRGQHQTPLINHIFEHLTTVAHVCIISVTIFFVVLSSYDFEFFNWHPILFSIGWMLLMTEAILMLTKDNILANRLTYAWRVRLHWWMQTTGMAMNVAGFVIVFIYEERAGNAHFRQNHSLYGLIAFVLALIPTCMSGIPALFNIKLRHIIPPKINKFIHATIGIACVIVGCVAMVMSLYTGWFVWKTGGEVHVFYLCFIAIVFGIFWSLVRPCWTFIERLISFNR